MSPLLCLVFPSPPRRVVRRTLDLNILVRVRGKLTGNSKFVTRSGKKCPNSKKLVIGRRGISTVLLEEGKYSPSRSVPSCPTDIRIDGLRLWHWRSALLPGILISQRHKRLFRLVCGPKVRSAYKKFVVKPLTDMFLGLTVALLVGSAMATGFDASNSSAPVDSTDHSWRRMLGESHPLEPNLQIESKFLHLLRTR